MMKLNMIVLYFLHQKVQLLFLCSICLFFFLRSLLHGLLNVFDVFTKSRHGMMWIAFISICFNGLPDDHAQYNEYISFDIYFLPLF